MRNRKSEVTNVDVVLWALAQAGGATRKVPSEEIAAEAHSIAPDRFSWQLPKYRVRGWPDKYIVKTALEDAKKKENGGLVTGDYANDLAKDGWTLTSRGARWIIDNAERQFHITDGCPAFQNTY